MTASRTSIELYLSSSNRAADLRAARDWLNSADELTGNATLVGAPPAPGRLGWEEVLAIALGGGGAVSAFVPALFSWLKQRTYDVRIVVRRPGTPEPLIELDATRVRDPEMALRLIDLLERLVHEERAKLTDGEQHG